MYIGVCSVSPLNHPSFSSFFLDEAKKSSSYKIERNHRRDGNLSVLHIRIMISRSNKFTAIAKKNNIQGNVRHVSLPSSPVSFFCICDSQSLWQHTLFSVLSPEKLSWEKTCAINVHDKGLKSIEWLVLMFLQIQGWWRQKGHKRERKRATWRGRRDLGKHHLGIRSIGRQQLTKFQEWTFTMKDMLRLTNED